jgi:hypothetical protein
MVDLQDQDVVAVLTRAPSAGGKTRLFRELGSAPDPALLAAFLLDTLEAVALRGVARAACVTPANAEPEIRALVPRDVLVLAQRGDSLGDRMRFAFDDLFARGAASVVLVGSDVPGIEPASAEAAFRILRERPRAVVLGPAADGGYYLIGGTQTPSAILADMRWSRSDVLAATERRAITAGLEVVRVAAVRDVDTLDDLRALIESDAPAGHTRAKCSGRRYTDERR